MKTLITYLILALLFVSCSVNDVYEKETVVTSIEHLGENKVSINNSLKLIDKGFPFGKIELYQYTKTERVQIIRFYQCYHIIHDGYYVLHSKKC